MVVQISLKPEPEKKLRTAGSPRPPSCSEQSHIRLHIVAAISQNQVRVKRRAGLIALSIALRWDEG